MSKRRLICEEVKRGDMCEDYPLLSGKQKDTNTLGKINSPKPQTNQIKGRRDRLQGLVQEEDLGGKRSSDRQFPKIKTNIQIQKEQEKPENERIWALKEN